MQNNVSLLLAGVSAACLAALPAQAAVHRFQQDHILGTSFALTAVGVDEQQAQAMREAALAEIARLDLVLSGWRSDSELARFNRASGPAPVSPDLFKVIAQCELWRARSDGAFSARMGEAEAAWRLGEQSGQTPQAAGLAALCGRAEAAMVRLDADAGLIDRDGAVFSIDALAKGYIIDAALDAAMAAAPEARGAMLDIGGDLRCRGLGPDGGAWRIGLAGGADADNLRPAMAIFVADRAVATSGPGARDLTLSGCDVNHTRVPATGQPAPARTVTVLADQTATADALATALGVMPLDQGMALAQSHGASARIVDATGETAATPDWAGLLLPARLDTTSPPPALIRTAGLTLAQARGKPWPAGFNVTIGYEIPQPNSGRAKAPYVVIWITDDQGKLVRTLYHLGNRPRRFLDSNYVWFKAFTDAGHAGELDSVTRPSRSPGRYTAVWDGKDDNGAPVPQGRYTVNIEMSREHGGHGVQSMALDLGAAPVSATAKAGEESGPASARYARAIAGPAI